MIRILLLLSLGLTAKSATGAENINNYLGEDIVWKALFMTGDDSIKAFDNARVKVVSMWKNAGIKPSNIRQLSMNPKLAKKGVRRASEKALDDAMKSLRPEPGDGCLLWMTSHGTEEGLYMRGQPSLSPDTLGKILDNYCGSLPTVVFVSACHSGVFLSINKPNRVILTAAHESRKSFGCGVKNVFTFWDQCMIKYYEASKTFEGLNYRTQICIKNREAEEEVLPSLPQSFFGDNAKLILVPRGSKQTLAIPQKRVKKSKSSLTGTGRTQ